MRRTKIIATIGPKTESEDAMRKLVHAGMNIARVNMFHGQHEWTKKVILRLKKLNTPVNNKSSFCQKFASTDCLKTQFSACLFWFSEAILKKLFSDF